VNSPPLKPLVNPLYKIKQSAIIAQCAEMRVIDQTLAPGEAVPWHLHPDCADYIICLRGELEIRELNPDRVTTLRPLERYLIREKQPHTTVNIKRRMPVSHRAGTRKHRVSCAYQT
jgi:quercetin dioxygenase-like cupin family protein